MAVYPVAEVYAETSEASGIYIEPYGEPVTVQDIRAVFGLSDAELPDEMLMQRVYSREVQATLLTMDSTLSETWADKLVAKPSLQVLLEDFALYCIADKLCDVLPLIAARTMSDSKATFQRFDTDLQAVINQIRQRYAVAYNNLEAALAETEEEELRLPTLFGSGSPSYDPVTGESS